MHIFVVHGHKQQYGEGVGVVQMAGGGRSWGEIEDICNGVKNKWMNEWIRKNGENNKKSLEKKII